MQRVALVAASCLYAVMWIGGVVSYCFLGGPPENAAWAAPAFLLVAAVVVLVAAWGRAAVLLAVAGLIGYGSEVLGVATGIPFSSYHYTDVLAPKLFGVPLVLACAWLVLVAYVREALDGLDLPRWVDIAAGALWMVAIDLIIDPLAAGPLAYWQWDGGGPYYGIPWVNFLGWFAVSVVIFTAIGRGWQPTRAGRVVGLSILAFFTSIAVAEGFYLAAAVGIALIGWDVVCRRLPALPPRKQSGAPGPAAERGRV